MALSDQYTTRSGSIPGYFNAILEAPPPKMFSTKFLASLGFSHATDRRIIGVLKDLGFVNVAGSLQQRYLDFLDRSKSRLVLADGIHEGYSDLFAIDKTANQLTVAQVKSKLRPLYSVKKTNLVIGHIAETFVALCQYADFSKAQIKGMPGLALGDDRILADTSGRGRRPDPVDQPWMPRPNPDPGGGLADDATIIDPGISSGRYLPLMHPGHVLEPVAITLSGGGAYGAFEVGALDFIYNQFMGSEQGSAAGFSRSRPDIVTGTSIGAVNGAWIAQGSGSVDELRDLWLGLRRNEDMFVLESAFQDLGHTVGKVAADFGWGLLATGLLPLGFLFFGQVGADISDLYTHLNKETSIFNLGPIRNILARREPYWSPTGPGLRGASVSAVRDIAGHRIVFARGYDDMLYVCSQLDIEPVSAGTRWSAWQSLGGPISSDPVAYHTARHGVGVIARQADGQYGAREFDHPEITNSLDHWYPWQVVPQPSSTWNVMETHGTTQPHVIQRATDGATWAFCRDVRGHAFSTANVNGYWEPWMPAGRGDGIVNNISGCRYSGYDILELFAYDDDFKILSSFSRDGSSPGDWLPWGGHATSDLLVIPPTSPEFVLDVFWRGTDGKVRTRRKDGPLALWGGQRLIGGDITSNLACGQNSEGVGTIFARGLDDELYALRQTSRNGAWPVNAWQRVGVPPGPSLLGDPYALSATPGSPSQTDGIEVYAVGSDHSVWTIRQRPDGSYTEWVSLGGKVWTGIQLRMSMVALEVVDDRFVDEAGRLAGTLEQIISGNDGDISQSRTNGMIASASLPGLFPPMRLNGRTWVDGGVRRGVPIGAAIDLGAKRVIAISTAPTTLLPVGRMLARTLSGLPDDAAGVAIHDYSTASIIDIAMRSLMRLVDDMHWAEIAPETKWPVPVSMIQPTFKIAGGDAIDPGLIRINYAYGWMRAFDMLMALPGEREAAIASTDRIINARCAAWTAESTFREQYLIATSPYTRPSGRVETDELAMLRQAAHLAEVSVGQSRICKVELRDALVARRNAGFPLDRDSPTWLARFEMCSPQEERWGAAWDRMLWQVPPSPFDGIVINVASDHIEHSELTVGAAPSPTLDG